MRNLPLAGAIAAVSLGLLYLVLGPEKTYQWTEVLHDGTHALGKAHRHLTYMSGAPERQTVELQLPGWSAPVTWTDDASVTPRAIVLKGSSVYLIASRWLVRGKPSGTPGCFYALEYSDPAKAWRTAPLAADLREARLLPLASPTTFLRFKYPSRLSFSRTLQTTVSPDGRVELHSYDKATMPSLERLGEQRCKRSAA